MVSTRRKPSTNGRKGSHDGKPDYEDTEGNSGTFSVYDMVDEMHDSTATGSVGNIDSTDRAFHGVVSEASNDLNILMSGTSSGSDTSVVEVPIASNAENSNGKVARGRSSSSSPGASKQFPKKKKKASKPTKPPIGQRSGLTTSLAFPVQRGTTAHTRSNAGNAELLTGVESIDTHPAFVQNFGGNVRSKLGSSLARSSNKANNASSNLEKSSTAGVRAMRNGHPVTKIVMNTGTLYIFARTHRAEFVRTK